MHECVLLLIVTALSRASLDCDLCKYCCKNEYRQLQILKYDLWWYERYLVTDCFIYNKVFEWLNANDHHVLVLLSPWLIHKFHIERINTVINDYISIYAQPHPQCINPVSLVVYLRDGVINPPAVLLCLSSDRLIGPWGGPSSFNQFSGVSTQTEDLKRTSTQSSSVASVTVYLHDIFMCTLNNKISTTTSKQQRPQSGLYKIRTAAGGSEANSAENGQQTKSLKHAPSAQMCCYQLPEGRAGAVCWLWRDSENTVVLLGQCLMEISCVGGGAVNQCVCMVCALWLQRWTGWFKE